MLGRLLKAISEAEAGIGPVSLIDKTSETVTRNVWLAISSEEIRARVESAIKTAGSELIAIRDSVLLAHQGGKIQVVPRAPINTREDLATYYTPGVAEVCQAIEHNPSLVYEYTAKGNMVAVVTDGTAVLGLGDIGPEAGLPVMEGKAMLFKEFGGVDAFPICLNTKNPDEIVNIVKALSPGLGGINLEDISAPRCFEIEERLKQELDIPVFHDDQHGTAVVVFAALTNALAVVGKKLNEVKIVINGTGAAGIAIAKILMSGGAEHIVGCDTRGTIYNGRPEHMNSAKQWLAEHTNAERLQGSIFDALTNADVFIGVSGPRILHAPDIKVMNHDAIVFALANPIPEIEREEALQYARVVATGSSSDPNQINNVLCFPGLFRGALDVRARKINEEMKLAAVNAIASSIAPKDLHAEHFMPSALDKSVARRVAQAVADAARKTGVARK
ncbi:MAG: NADP-dependent malic enzyme [Candidatus Spechtbacteria bacterium]|nr:NADP-dependent malic enzyme [Candidatus Spechtbacteria bacterium]